MADGNNNVEPGEYFKINLIKDGEEVNSIRKLNLRNTTADIVNILCETNIKTISVFADDAEVAPNITFAVNVIRSFGGKYATQLLKKMTVGKTMLFDYKWFYSDDATDLVDNDDIARLREQFGIVRPICSVCKLTKPVKTRNVINSIKQK